MLNMQNVLNMVIYAEYAETMSCMSSMNNMLNMLKYLFYHKLHSPRYTPLFGFGWVVQGVCHFCSPVRCLWQVVASPSPAPAPPRRRARSAHSAEGGCAWLGRRRPSDQTHLSLFYHVPRPHEYQSKAEGLLLMVLYC